MKYTHSFKKMKIRCIAVAMLFTLSFAASAQETKGPHSIVFTKGNFSSALQQAATQHKYVFVDAYASWCGPCKLLKATTFHNKKAADFYNANFVNISIDMEKGEGPQLASAWGITAYPTLIIFDPSGKPLLGTMGYMGAADLVKFGKQALSKVTAN
jgi:thioredoxin 1